MSKVFWHVTMSLDGFIAGPNDAMDWVFGYVPLDAPATRAMLEEIIRTTSVHGARKWKRRTTRRFASAFCCNFRNSPKRRLAARILRLERPAPRRCQALSRTSSASAASEQGESLCDASGFSGIRWHLPRLHSLIE
jgi:hypothetical protein